MSEIPARREIPFSKAARYPLKALLFTIAHPSLWPYCIGPLLINIIIVVLVWHYAGVFLDRWLDGYFTSSGWLWTSLRWLREILEFLVRIIATFITFVIVGPIAAVPFNDFLSERVDAIVLGWKDPRPFQLWRKTKEITVILVQELIRLAIYISIIIALFLLSLFPLLSPFTTITQLFVTAIFFTMDYLSYPLERRGAIMLSQKYGFARAHWSATMGFGATMTLIGLIPLVNFVFIPLGVVGGTLLFADVFRADNEQLRITKQ